MRAFDELRLLDGGHVRPARHHQELALRACASAIAVARNGGVKVSRSPATTSTGHVDVRQEIARRVLAGGAQHAQEHREVDVRHVRQVRQHVLGVHALRVDLARP